MINEMIYILIYVVCMMVMLTLFAFYKSQLKVWQKVIAVIFAPVMVVVLIVGTIFLCIDHIVKHGFHNILPRRKGKAYPLDKSDFSIWGKDYVLDGNDKVRIDDFNEKYNKALTLDDVYGTGFIDNMTPEEVYKCKTFIPGKYGLEPNMPEYQYKDIAIAFADLFTSWDAGKISQYLTDKSHLILFKREEIIGNNAITEYFQKWLTTAKEKNLQVRVSVEWNANQCRPVVYVSPKGYNKMILIFILKEGHIDAIILGPRLIQNAGARFHDLDTPTYNLEFMSQFFVEDADSAQFHLSCPSCGTDSVMLDWYTFQMGLGKIGYSGMVSICPDCKRVVELQPDTRYKFDEALHPAFPRPIPENCVAFTPRLKGLYSFESRDDLEFYSENGLQVTGPDYWESYKKSGDIEAANNYGIYLANSGDSMQAIEVFTEIAEKGCHNAMLNIFTIYWANEQDYKKAAEWLEYISGSDNPSIKCIWNLATLCYFGENLPNNPLRKDLIKAKHLLARIKDLPLENFDNDYKRVIVDAGKFYNLVDVINDFSLSGIDIHHIITDSIVKTENQKDKGELFSHAKALAPIDGLKLGLKLADNGTDAIGDESSFYLYNDKGQEHKVGDGGIVVQPTPMGAWQYYLLMTASTIMPVFWHGGYSVRKFIFSTDDLKSIEPIDKFDFSILNQDDILLPKSVISKDGKSADVYCTYWNDWKGLVREHVRIMFNADGTATYGKSDEFCFYHYDCGIRF